MPEAAGSSPALSLSLLHGEKNKFGKEFTMEKRPLDTELEVLWSEHLEDDVFSVHAYNVLAHRLGLRTLPHRIFWQYDYLCPGLLEFRR